MKEIDDSFSTVFCSKSTYFCIISIFLRGSGGVSHSNTMHLIVSLSNIDHPIYQEENSFLPQKCSRKLSLIIKIHLKSKISIKTSAIQSFTWLSLHKISIFPLRISSVNVTKPAGNRRKLRIWSHLVKKSLMENFIFFAVYQ